MKKHQKKQRSFNPDEVSNQLHRAICADLGVSYPPAPCHTVYDRQLLAKNVYREAQSRDFLKKYVPQTAGSTPTYDAAIAKFVDMVLHMEDTNNFLKPYTFQGSGIEYQDQGTPCAEAEVLAYARGYIKYWLGTLSEEDLFELCRNSAGTTLGLKYSETNIEDKIKFPITVTAYAKPIFDRYLAWDTRLKQAMLYYNDCPMDGQIEYQVVEGSRTTTVPKNNEIDRVIAVEPTANMFLQQGLGILILKNLKKYGVDLSTLQVIHQNLAYESSITSRKATIDFSSASDCVSIALVERLLPPDWFAYIMRIRSPVSDVNNQTIELPMISTMGNATTFPLETLIFYAIACASICVKKNLHRHGLIYDGIEVYTHISVFGDDCVISEDYVDLFVRSAVFAGFIVNHEKSFVTPSGFRESCGGDYFRGHNVRPFYLRAPHNTKRSSLEPWLYTITNRLLKKYISYFGALEYVYDKDLWRLLEKLFLKWDIEVKFVPSYYPDDSGIRLWSDSDRLKRHALSKCRFSKIFVDKHGTHKFRCINFQYRTKTAPFARIRYWLSLKRLTTAPVNIPYNSHLVKGATDVKEYYVSKRIGGYVVGTGYSDRMSQQ